MTGDEIITVTQVVHLTGVGRNRIYQLMRADLFPRRKVQGARGGWSKHEVQTWLRRRERIL